MRKKSNRTKPAAPRYVLTMIDRSDGSMYSVFQRGSNYIVERTDRVGDKTEVGIIPRKGSTLEDQQKASAFIGEYTGKKVIAGRLV